MEKQTLVKLTKTQVKARIRKEGYWAGYLAPNKVAPFHVAGGWYCGAYKVLETESAVDYYAETMPFYMEPELGNRVAYWEEVPA